MSKPTRSNHHPDCTVHDKSSRALFPPELSSVFARIDPLTDLHPYYTNPNSNQVTNLNLMKALPVTRFEQLLDQKDLNSIQL